jgi:alkanesulfonate monooxygenase SsuD/methylene tetrahydromethanopterin reductase-like flavin-dependent oxidoreductase (luciferase family)
VATVDHISQGRFDFGVGRSGFARAYEGYDVPYGESRERFQECLEIILSAWIQERFSYQGKYYTFNDIHVLPKPYQQPHPPLRVAATTRDTFPQVGTAGYPIFVGLRGMDRPDLVHYLNVYRDAWHEAGHAGNGDVYLRLPIYVASTAEQARSEPEASTMHSYRRLAQSFATSAASVGTTVSEERAQRAQRLSKVTYDELLQDRLAYGTPEAVVAQVNDMQEELQLSGVLAEMNVGGLNAQEKVLDSLRLFTKEVVPALR